MKIENKSRILLAKIVKILNPKNYNYKYIQIINYININTIGDLKLTNIKKILEIY